MILHCRVPPGLVRWPHLALVLALSAHGAQADDWSDRKCALYQDAVTDALHALGADGIRPEFTDQNEAFLAGGCTGPEKVCAVTPEERALADMLTVMTMNEGMASTFVPFACPD
ncbi:hypothetical protein [Pseudooceanicola onchidii]|uniref:hypothetical protein n=1 Tax=Pseudooceanicola onchidii TaxID=2562279 RepID=UPI0010AA3F93|nr:hypothetical protein [Pseudooceanicola onchidii]